MITTDKEDVDSVPSLDADDAFPTQNIDAAFSTQNIAPHNPASEENAPGYRRPRNAVTFPQQAAHHTPDDPMTRDTAREPDARDSATYSLFNQSAWNVPNPGTFPAVNIHVPPPSMYAATQNITIPPPQTGTRESGFGSTTPTNAATPIARLLEMQKQRQSHDT